MSKNISLNNDSAALIKFSGGPPQWEFIDETRRKYVDLAQERYKKQLRERIIKRKKDEKSLSKIHGKLVDLVGPEWYQELSPNQMKTVDNLRNCIITDVKLDSFTRTQENIFRLGVMLRPNHRHIKAALVQCNQCPIEFLLILYQLIHPTRMNYSLNDRLLLSAVVHLSMADTLRELHVRIPSPPPRQTNSLIISRPTGKKRKRNTTNKKDTSPYLIPFNFVPKPQKFTGIYRNKHRQYPDNPYFLYNNDNNNQCSYRFDTKLADEEDRILNAKKCECTVIDENDNMKKCCNLPTCNCYDPANEYTGIKPLKKNNNIVRRNDPPADDYNLKQCYNDNGGIPCDLNQRVFDLTKCEYRTIQFGLPADTCYCKYREDNNKLEVVSAANNSSTTTSVADEILPETPSCECLEKRQEKIAQYHDYIKRINARLHLKMQPNKYVIGGVVNRPAGEPPIYIISSVIPTECDCRQPVVNNTTNYELDHPEPKCECKTILDQFEQEHATCINLYENYLTKIQRNFNEHMEDERLRKIVPVNEMDDGESVVKTIDQKQPLVSRNDKNFPVKIEDIKEKAKICLDKLINTIRSEIVTAPAAELNQTEINSSADVGCCKDKEIRLKPSCLDELIGKIKTKLEENIYDEQCKDKDEVELLDENSEKKELMKENVQEDTNSTDSCICVGDDETYESKRIIRLRKIPCRYDSQLKIIKVSGFGKSASFSFVWCLILLYIQG